MTNEQLKTLRDKLEMSQQTLAAELGYTSFVQISRKETGAVAITPQDRIILSLKFKKQLRELKIKL